MSKLFTNADLDNVESAGLKAQRAEFEKQVAEIEATNNKLKISDALLKLIKELDVNEENYFKYFDEDEIKKEIIKDIDTYGRKNDLKGFELPKKIYLCKEPFSIKNQIITPTMKIRRHIAKKFFAKEINKLYGLKG